MSKTRKPRVLKWRDARSISGYIAQLSSAIAGCSDGAYVQLDLKTAIGLREIAEQAKHTEEGVS